MAIEGRGFAPEPIALAALKPHPRNYRAHPEDQLEHLRESLKEHGWYRNVLVARDGTLLAGHGIVQAARQLGYTEAPAIRLDLAPDDPRALKVLAADNELAHLAEVDDRALSELLREIKDADLDGLLGTGFDEAMLANLVFVTRPMSEVRDHHEAAEWAGMPEYEAGAAPLSLVVKFATAAAREDFARRLGLRLTPAAKSLWWPPREAEDIASVRLEA